jgi:proline dehydrogenase
VQVQVATHDAPLADRALRMLVEAGVPCEHQVLHGMKAQPAMEVARRLGVQTRVLVSYGTGRVPYSVRAAIRDPRAAYRLARDLVRRNRVISLS